MIRNFKLLDLLPELEPDEQLAVFERIIRSPRPQVRQRALGLGAAILSESKLLKYLRDEDDVRRNAGIEMLKLRRRRSLELACHLLEDDDHEVVLQAVLVLSHLRDRRAVEPLLGVLDHEDANVVQEAVMALARIGDARALPALLPLLDRIPWIQAAVIEALGRLGGAEVVPDLEKILDSPTLGPLALDALAQIGGLRAAAAAARYWVEHGEQFEPAFTLRRLADLLEGLTCAPPEVAGLAESLQESANDPIKEVRLAAARCLVALRGKNRSLFMF